MPSSWKKIFTKASQNAFRKETKKKPFFPISSFRWEEIVFVICCYVVVRDRKTGLQQIRVKSYGNVLNVVREFLLVMLCEKLLRDKNWRKMKTLKLLRVWIQTFNNFHEKNPPKFIELLKIPQLNNKLS